VLERRVSDWEKRQTGESPEAVSPGRSGP